MQAMIQMIKHGWPLNKKHLPDQLRAYFSFKEELSTRGGLILRGEKIVIPQSIRQTMKERGHSLKTGQRVCGPADRRLRSLL